MEKEIFLRLIEANFPEVVNEAEYIKIFGWSPNERNDIGGRGFITNRYTLRYGIINELGNYCAIKTYRGDWDKYRSIISKDNIVVGATIHEGSSLTFDADTGFYYTFDSKTGKTYNQHGQEY